jgi:type I restriction enzyme S subunit
MDNERRALPEGWEWKRLGDVADIRMGQSPPGSTYNETGAGFPFLQGNAEFNDVFPKHIKYTTEPSKIAPKGSILISVRAPVGDINIANLDYCIGRGLASISLIKGDNKYLFYLLNYLKPKIEDKGTGSTFKAISKLILNEIQIPLPPLPTQRRIVSILEKAEETKKLRAQVDELTNRLLQSVFLEMFGDPVKNPKGWDMVTLGDVVEESMNGFGRRSQENLEKKPIVLRIKDVQNGYIDISSPRRITMSSEEYQQYQLKKNDFLYVRVNGSLELVGKSAIVPEIKEEITFSDHIVRVRFYQTKICSIYVHFLAQTSYFRLNLLKQVVTTAGQNSLGFNRLAKIIIPLPPLPHQQKFARVVEKVESMRQSQNQSKQQIEDLFSALMQKAFRGEI